WQRATAVPDRSSRRARNPCAGAADHPCGSILASARCCANIVRRLDTAINERLMLPKIELNHKVHVLTRKEELDTVRVPGKVVIVIDIIFATTTMVAALAHGATEIIPVLDEAAARAEGARRGVGTCVLAGGLYAEPLPQALLECRLGRMMSARGLRHEVEFACRTDAFPVVPMLEDGRLGLVT